ncbi:MAG: phosphomannomutase/phosphoglucomutase [Patescibacteria group bacterium]
MNINPFIFRAYDIRGIATHEAKRSELANKRPPKADTFSFNKTSYITPDLTAKSSYLIGKATGEYLKKKYNTKTIAVGRDNRLTSSLLQKSCMKGLIDSGLNVTDIGLATSPMIYWTTYALNFDAGINITASHNPKQYNGFKIVGKFAHSICGEELQEILKIIQKNKKPPIGKKPKKGTLEKLNIWPKYLADITKRVRINKKLKIVIDAGNGVAGKFAPELLEKIGCKITKLYCKLDGRFPNHEANPEELKNMKALIKKVKETHADLGIGFDGDGDRIGVVDEKGHLYSSDFMLLLLAKDLVKRIKNPKIVFDIKVSQVIIDELKRLGAHPVMSKTGHSFIESKMKEISASLGGEVSGHLFCAENYYGFDDALYAACKIIEIISKEPRPLSELFENLTKVYTTEEFKAPCPDNKKFQIVKSLVEHFTKLYDCITIDGVRISFDKNSWGAVRASNTSPNLTLRFEANTKKRLAEIQKIMADEFKKYKEASLKWYKNK